MDDTIPPSFMCPITHDVMRDPCVPAPARAPPVAAKEEPALRATDTIAPPLRPAADATPSRAACRAVTAPNKTDSSLFLPCHLIRVTLSDGHSYERRSIERWLTSNNTSPVTNSELPNSDVVPNHALRNSILEHFQR